MFDYLAQNIDNNTPFQGINFWAWGGEGRPRIPRSIYETGDDLIGDPPHEYQGWYSVYNTDYTTHKLIRSFNEKYNATMTKSTENKAVEE
jgi:mannan endo-1,4-beta-mannosidase